MATDSENTLPGQAKALESCLLKALETPSAQSIESFYRAFLEGHLFVPRRFQKKQVNNLSAFPSPFLDVLAVPMEEENYIPAFTSLSELNDWSEEELEYLRLTGEELCKRAPEGWWITLNPAGECGKEVSPWEVERLRGGHEALEEGALEELIVEQLRGEDPTITFEPVPEETATKLSQELRKPLEDHKDIESIYVGIHKSADSPERYIAGVLLKDADGSSDLKDELESTFERIFIGDIPIEVHYGENLESSPSLALFRFSQPIVQKKQKSKAKDLLGRLRNFLSCTP